MRLPTIAVAVLAALAGSIAGAEPLPDCAAVPLPSAEAREPYAKGPYGRGMALAARGSHREAARALAAAWGGVLKTLEGSFARTDCRAPAIRKSLSATVYVAPPKAVPAEDRFLPPPVVTWTAAAEACAAGDPAGAADWLVPAALAGDPDAAAVAALMLAAAGRPADGLALLPPASEAPAVVAARARIGKPNDAPRPPMETP